ncbi:MAG: hypothetical protein GWM91_16515, partial [Actinobacteria bacterium]|nr:hypothetical protein [Actinomycetota bacterium]NIV57087.1 hypothetical protein [Actinomycetota bacterium]NIX51908.1 hypothetical protein [Actinomycetota bacterium]
MSRILLATSKTGAVVVAGVVSVLILLLAILVTQRPQISRNLTAGLALVLGVGVLAGGVIATVSGEREFHVHEVHTDDEEHGDDHDDESEDHSDEEDSDG